MAHHVLIVDDDAVLLEVLATVLELESFTVATASGGADALASIAADPPEVLVCEVAMADIDGLEVCRRIKADPATASIRVVLLAPRSAPADHAAGAAAGCDAYVTKPFSPLDLIDVLRGLLSGPELPPGA